MMKKRKRIAAALIIAAVIFAAVGYALLPDTLVVQVGTNGQASNTMAKLPALLLPLALTSVFAVLYGKSDKDDSGAGKNLIVSAVGILISILTFVFNL